MTILNSNFILRIFLCLFSFLISFSFAKSPVNFQSITSVVISIYGIDTMLHPDGTHGRSGRPVIKIGSLTTRDSLIIAEFRRIRHWENSPVNLCAISNRIDLYAGDSLLLTLAGVIADGCGFIACCRQLNCDENKHFPKSIKDKLLELCDAAPVKEGCISFSKIRTKLHDMPPAQVDSIQKKYSGRFKSVFYSFSLPILLNTLKKYYQWSTFPTINRSWENHLALVLQQIHDPLFEYLFYEAYGDRAGFEAFFDKEEWFCQKCKDTEQVQWFIHDKHVRNPDSIRQIKDNCLHYDTLRRAIDAITSVMTSYDSLTLKAAPHMLVQLSFDIPVNVIINVDTLRWFIRFRISALDGEAYFKAVSLSAGGLSSACKKGIDDIKKIGGVSFDDTIILPSNYTSSKIKTIAVNLGNVSSKNINYTIEFSNREKFSYTKDQLCGEWYQ